MGIVLSTTARSKNEESNKREKERKEGFGRLEEKGEKSFAVRNRT